MVFALFKPFLREKLKSRIHFHGTDRKSLHEHIDPKYLPDTYGGSLDIPQITGSQWLELLLKCEKEYTGKKHEVIFISVNLHYGRQCIIRVCLINCRTDS